jgi:hypothetical protein
MDTASAGDITVSDVDDTVVVCDADSKFVFKRSHEPGRLQDAAGGPAQYVSDVVCTFSAETTPHPVTMSMGSYSKTADKIMCQRVVFAALRHIAPK